MAARTFVERRDLLAKADKLRVAAIVMILGFSLSVCVHYWMSAYCGWRYPFSTYLYRPGDITSGDAIITKQHCFGDLLAVCIHAQDCDPYFAVIPQDFSPPVMFPSNYFPFGAMLAYPLTRVPYPWAVGLFILSFLGFLAAFNWTFMRTGHPLADAIPIIVMTVMNYPAQMIVDRGNIEAWVFGYVAAFAMLIARRWTTPAAVMLGAAIAMKAAPVVFLPACYKAARQRGVAVALGTAALLTVASLLLMKTPVHVSLARLFQILANYRGGVSKGLEATNHASSLYGLFSAGAWFSQSSPGLSLIWNGLLSGYPVIAGIILAVSTISCFVLPMRLWEIGTVAGACLVLLPQASPDYRLIHMMIPFALFVNSRMTRSAGIVTGILFALLFVPKSFVVLAYETTLNSILNPLILLALLVLAIAPGFQRRFGRSALVSEPLRERAGC